MLTTKLFTLMQILALAFVYLLSSQLCSLVGAPNEFGSVIWPPAGISLACLVMFGSRLWLGVLLGAFLANLYFIFNLANTLTSLSYITASLEAIGATLEALAGAWLLRNLAHFPNPLHTERQIGSLIVLLAVLYLVNKVGSTAFFVIKHCPLLLDEATLVFSLLFVGFGFKIPIWPFHYWLTKVHVEAPSGFSIYLSGFLVKTALFGLFKLSNLLFHELNTEPFIFIAFLGAIDASLKM